MSDVPDCENPRPRWAHFGEMSWPVPDRGLGELQWRLRYSPALTTPDRLSAAAVLDAYMQMVVDDSSRKRAYVVRELRAALAPPTEESRDE